MKEKKLQFLLVVFILIFAVSGYFLIFSNNSVEVSAMKSYKGSITKTIEITGILNSSDVEIILTGF